MRLPFTVWGPLALVTLTGSADARAQAVGAAGPVIDTVVIVRDNVFSDQQAQTSTVFRVMNKLHITTRPGFIRNNLLFKQGEPYDSARVSESERILRSRQIFRELTIDTTHIDDKFAVVVRTQDGWSTKPKIKFQVASDGNWTGTFGINEVNLLGTGNQFYIAYVKEVDRDGLNLTLDFQRLFGSNFDASGNYAGLSDGRNGNWKAGVPFRAFETQNSVMYDGLAANQRVFRYRRENSATLDTASFRRSAALHNLTAGLARKATSTQYLRLVATAGYRQEEYVPEANAGAPVPDSTTGTLGLYVEIKRARFLQVRGFNGFGTEDVDLSTTLRVTGTLAPKAFGWPETSIGPGLGFSSTALIGKAAFIWGAIDLNWLPNETVPDSGRIVANLAFGYKPHPRHATMAQIQWGRQKNTPPGQEFNLGFESAPRGWEPHSFVGTRMLWISAEHRWFVWDALLNLFGVGFAGFLDYGGAWYADQDRRYGGNLGVGLRMGSALTTVPTTGRIDFAYRFGDDVTGSRWVLSLGTGFIFPRRAAPVINYRATAPP